MIKLCIFDLDGTVLNTLDTIAYFANQALIKNGISPIETKAYKYLVGGGIKQLIHKMLAYRGLSSEELYCRVYEDYDQAYSADVAYKTVIYDGLKEVLDALKHRGVALSIVSNKPDNVTRGVVHALFEEGYFAYVTGQVPGGALKPDPTAVLSLISRMGISPEDCVYIGDTSTDMLTGKNAGIFTVGVTWGFRDREELTAHGADAVIDTPAELLAWVERFSQKDQGSSV